MLCHPAVAQPNPTGLPQSEILPLCCGTRELPCPTAMHGRLRNWEVSADSKQGYGQQIPQDSKYKGTSL